MPIARFVSPELNRFLLGWPGPPGWRRGVPDRLRRAALAALACAGSLLVHAEARADLALPPLDPTVQQLDPTQQPLPPDFPRGWQMPVPPPLPDPGSSATQVNYDPTTGLIEERFRS